jgi:fructose-specific phosphotransferase system IIC component
MGSILGALLAVGGEMHARSEGLEPMSLPVGIGILVAIGGLAGAVFHLTKLRRRGSGPWSHLSWTVSCALGGAAFSVIAEMVDRSWDIAAASILVLLAGAIGFSIAVSVRWLAGDSGAPME